MASKPSSALSARAMVLAIFGSVPAFDRRGDYVRKPLQLYGQQILNAVGKLKSKHLFLHEGNVYGVLRQLEKDGLAKSKPLLPPPSRGGRTRYLYWLTSKGSREARELRDEILNLFDAGAA